MAAAPALEEADSAVAILVPAAGIVVPLEVGIEAVSAAMVAAWAVSIAAVEIATPAPGVMPLLLRAWDAVAEAARVERLPAMLAEMAVVAALGIAAPRNDAQE